MTPTPRPALSEQGIFTLYGEHRCVAARALGRPVLGGRMARRVVEVTGIAPPRSFYSHGMIAPGPTLWVAGQVALRPDGSIEAGDAATQTEVVLDNLRAVVEQAGASMADVVRTTIYLTDIADRDAVTEVRERYFPAPAPPNTLLVVAGLAHRDFCVEIDAVVALPLESAET